MLFLIFPIKLDDWVELSSLQLSLVSWEFVNFYNSDLFE